MKNIGLRFWSIIEQKGVGWSDKMLLKVLIYFIKFSMIRRVFWSKNLHCKAFFCHFWLNSSQIQGLGTYGPHFLGNFFTGNFFYVLVYFKKKTSFGLGICPHKYLFFLVFAHFWLVLVVKSAKQGLKKCGTSKFGLGMPPWAKSEFI